MTLTTPAPTTQRTASARRAGRRGFEILVVIAGALFLGFTSTNAVVGVLLTVLVLVAAGIGVLMRKPGLLVPIAVVSMWFDNAGAGPIRTGRVIAALLFMLLALRAMTTDWRPPALQPRAWLPTAAFLTWAAISGFWSAQLGTWVQGQFELLLGVTYALIFLLFLEDEPKLARGFKLFAWVGVPIALLSWFLYRGLQNTSKETGIENRTHGFTGNANVYAFVLMATVPIVVVFMRRATSRIERLAYFGILGTIAMALMASGSRSGLLSMGAMAMYVFVTFPGLDNRQRVRSTVAGGVFVIFGLLLAGIVNPDRFSLAGFLGDAGAGRAELWNAAISTFGLHPIQGSGIGGFRSQVLDILTKVEGTFEITRSPVNRDAKELEAHNLYLSLLLDLGIIGLCVWGVQYLSVARNLWDLRKHPVWRDWVWALGGTHLCLLITAAFGSTYNMKFSWTIIGFSGAMYVRAVQAPKAAPGTAIMLRDAPASLRPALVSRAKSARLDLRLGVPFRRALIGGIALGAVLGGLGAAIFGSTQYRTSAQVLVVNLDNNGDPRLGVQITDTRIQAILTLARSDPYFAEVQRQARLDQSVDELDGVIDSTRARFSSVIRIDAHTSDRQAAERISRVLISSLDATVDQYRAGALSVPGTDGRTISPDVSPDYRGPVYLRLWNIPRVDTTAPRTTHSAIVGGTLAALFVLIATMLAHQRPRLTTREDVAALLGIPFVATVPRPRSGRRADATAYFRTAGDCIDGACAEGANLVTVTGVDAARLRARTTVGIALGLAALSERPLVLVDLDVERARLSRLLGVRRFRGWTDLVAAQPSDGPAASITDDDWLALGRPIRRHRLGRQLRRLGKVHADRVRVIPVGRHRDLFAAGDVLDQMVASLARQAVVVVNLPTVPGRLPVQSVVELADANLVVVLDGWTMTEAALVASETLDAAAPNRVGYVVIEQ